MFILLKLYGYINVLYSESYINVCTVKVLWMSYNSTNEHMDILMFIPWKLYGYHIKIFRFLYIEKN